MREVFKAKIRYLIMRVNLFNVLKEVERELFTVPMTLLPCMADRRSHKALHMYVGTSELVEERQGSARGIERGRTEETPP